MTWALLYWIVLDELNQQDQDDANAGAGRASYSRNMMLSYGSADAIHALSHFLEVGLYCCLLRLRTPTAQLWLPYILPPAQSNAYSLCKMLRSHLSVTTPAKARPYLACKAPVPRRSTALRYKTNDMSQPEKASTQIPTQGQDVQPGLEHELKGQKPIFIRDTYKGSGKLDGKVAIITGGDSGIGRAVAVHFAREGADVSILYLEEETKDAQETEEIVKKEGRKCLLFAGDVANPTVSEASEREAAQGLRQQRKLAACARGMSSCCMQGGQPHYYMAANAAVADTIECSKFFCIYCNSTTVPL